MKSGATLALAIGVGAAGVIAYLLLSRHPESVVAAGVVETDETPASNTAPERGATAREIGAPAPRPEQGAQPPVSTELSAALTQRSQFARARALVAVAADANVDTLRRLVAEAGTLTVPADRRDALDVFLMRWFELDSSSAPRDLLDEALAQPLGVARSDRVSSIAHAWAQVDAEEAWQYAARIADSNTRMAYENAVLAAWGERDPERTLAVVIAMPGGWRKDQLLRQASVEMARKDPRRALEMAATAKRGDGRQLVANILNEWAVHDVRAAAQWFAANPGRLNRAFAGQIATRYGAVDPIEAIAWAQRIDRSGMRGIAGMALGSYAEVDGPDALRLALALESDGQRIQAIAWVLGAIARRDPGYAMANLDKVPGGRARTEATEAIASQLMRSDPRAAVEWLRQLDDAEARRNGLMNVGHMLADSDPDTAASLIEQIPADSRTMWISSVANAYAQQDPDMAIRWVRNYQNEPGYQQILSQFTSRLAFTDAAAAFELAAGISDTRQRDQMLTQLMTQGYPMRSPEIAARWLERVSDERMRVQAVGSIATGWAQQDAAAARKWVSSLASGAMRDQGLGALVGHSSFSLEDTASLIGQIQSPERRMDATWQSAMRLAQSDIEAARTLVRRHPLDPSRRETLATHLREQYGATL